MNEKPRYRLQIMPREKYFSDRTIPNTLFCPTAALRKINRAIYNPATHILVCYRVNPETSEGNTDII